MCTVLAACRTALSTRLPNTRRSASRSPSTTASGNSARGHAHAGAGLTARHVEEDVPQGHRLGGLRRRSLPVEPRQHQQVLDERGHPGHLRVQVAGRLRVLAEPFGDLELGPHRAQRAAQLVGGVRHERALPRARGREPVEHGVQGHRERVHLVA